MAPQKGHPLLESTKGAALSGLTGSRLTVTKLWCLIYVAAHSCWGWTSCSLGASKPLSPTGLWSSATRDARKGLRMNTQNALPPGFTRLAASLQSHSLNSTFSREDPPIRKGSPSHSRSPHSTLFSLIALISTCLFPSPTPPAPRLTKLIIRM